MNMIMFLGFVVLMSGIFAHSNGGIFGGTIVLAIGVIQTL